MYRVDELWAWIVTDDRGDEAVVVGNVGDGRQPLMAVTASRAQSLRGEAARAASELGMPPPNLVRFTRARPPSP